DNFTGDDNPTSGVIELNGVIVGQYIVEISTAPAGYLAPASQNVDVTADTATDVTFTLEEARVETGGLQIQMQTLDGSTPDPDEACVILSGGPQGDFFQTLCDNDANDEDASTGSIVVDNLPVGVYSVTQGDPETPDNVSLAEARSLAPQG